MKLDVRQKLDYIEIFWKSRYLDNRTVMDASKKMNAEEKSRLRLIDAELHEHYGILNENEMSLMSMAINDMYGRNSAADETVRFLTRSAVRGYECFRLAIKSAIQPGLKWISFFVRDDNRREFRLEGVGYPVSAVSISFSRDELRTSYYKPIEWDSLVSSYPGKVKVI